MIKQIGLTNQPLYPVKTFVPQSQKEQPVLNQVKKDTVKFGAVNEISDALVGAGDPATLAASYAIKKIIGSFTLSESDKAKLKEHEMPDEFFKGLNKLKDAEKKDNIESEVREAKLFFDLAADKAKLHTFRRASNRMAAISAKLLNELKTAREFMDKSLGNSFFEDCEKIRNLSSVAQNIITGAKMLVFVPFAAIESLGQKILNKPEDTPLISVDLLEKATPLFMAQDNLVDLVGEKDGELDIGYDSDNEWIDGKDPKDLGTSTGTGMRHHIPLVEKQRLAKKDGNDLISGMSKVTLK